MTARFADHLIRGTAAGIPAASDVPVGTLYEESDTGVVRQSDGSSWTVYALTVPPGGSTGQVLAKTSGADYDADWAAAGGGGGAALSDFRLPGVGDDGTAFGATTLDEMEYAGTTPLSAVWTAIAGTGLRAAGSEAVVQLPTTAGHGIWIDASGFDPSYEVAFLVSGHGPAGSNVAMLGIQLTSAAGVGIAMTPYSDGNSYLWEVGSGTAHVYASTGPSGGVAYTAWEDGRPVWFAIRYDGAGHYRLRRSEDGATWTTLIASASRAAVAGLARVGFFNANAGSSEAVSVHAVIYGTPDLGV